MLETSQLRQKIAGLRGRFEDELAALVEVPTISMDPARRKEMDACAALAGDYLRALGARVDLIDTGGFPLVMGRLVRDPSWPTVTIYNHLDVQPADGPEWRSPPFSFTRAGDSWFGRGTTDDKGPALTALYGARLALEEDARVNVQFLWELEEEIGSPNFERGLAAAIAGDAAAGRPPFRTDSVVVSDTIWIAAGRPAIAYGLRGLLGFTVTLQTGAKDVHSGTTGGAARNPVAELAALIAACVDARTGKVKIPGFYADVRRLSAAEKKAFGRAGFSAKRFQSAHELYGLRPHRDDLAVMESIMALPTFEVHGLVGGYAGPGIKTIVPHRAEAKLSTRLVPDQRPAKIFELVRRFIKKQLPDAVIAREGALEPYLAPIGGPHNAAAAETMRETFGREPGFTREGGSIGAVLTMRRLLNAPVTFMGLSLPEHGYHAINENYDWGQASGGMEMFRRYFHKVAAMGQPAKEAAGAPLRRPARRRG
ncbi:MAG TPA: M20/M25/M40 family metallo-hydrolase [Polyangia bacterium]|jgi:acetylornithine deacetylase/succinyl-diaminopimelate desuccinylase-like protein